MSLNFSLPYYISPVRNREHDNCLDKSCMVNTLIYLLTQKAIPNKMLCDPPLQYLGTISSFCAASFSLPRPRPPASVTSTSSITKILLGKSKATAIGRRSWVGGWLRGSGLGRRGGRSGCWKDACAFQWCGTFGRLQ